MWEGVLQKAKKGGLNVIQTYVFWNIHEPVKGQVNNFFMSKLILQANVGFVKVVGVSFY